MKRNPDIINELRSISPRLAEIDPRPVQTLPDGYFDQFPEQLSTRLSHGLGGQDISLPASSLPAGYFDQLPGRILDRIRATTGSDVANDETLPPVLAGVSRTMPHHVPVGYFEGFERKLASGLTSPAPVVSMERRSTGFRYAAAAAVTGLLLVSAWYFLLNGPVKGSMPDGKTEMASRSVSVDSLRVSDKDLASFLEQTDGLESLNNSDTLVSTNSELALLDLDEKGISEILRTLPDKALAEYIDEPGLNNTPNRSN